MGAALLRRLAAIGKKRTVIAAVRTLGRATGGSDGATGPIKFAACFAWIVATEMVFRSRTTGAVAAMGCGTGVGLGIAVRRRACVGSFACARGSRACAVHTRFDRAEKSIVGAETASSTTAGASTAGAG